MADFDNVKWLYSVSQKDEVCRGMLQPLQCQAFHGKIGTSPFRERLYLPDYSSDVHFSIIALTRLM